MKTLVSSQEQKKSPILNLYTKLSTIDNNSVKIENNDINIIKELKNLPDSFLNQFVLTVYLENTIEEKMVKKKKKL